MAKNVAGRDASLYCRRHDEAGGFPRRLDPERDHFPEHRRFNHRAADYGDGQVASAALWAARLGMRSRSSVLGPGEFAAGVQRALRNAGFILEWSGNSDLGLYQAQQDLLRHLVDRWGSAKPGSAASVNKVLAGFASAGLFLVAHECLAQPRVASPNCRGGPAGADAIIDVDDRDPLDDPIVLGVVHPEHDFVRFRGRAPRLRVWTGPRYRLDGPDGSHTFHSPAPCNRLFRVELSLDPSFTMVSGDSGWIRVSTRSLARTACEGSWIPSRRLWRRITAGGSGTRVYYRARTRSDTAESERLSTRPGNGLWDVPPPFLVVTATGAPDY